MKRKVATRAVLLAVTAASLYLLAPSLLAVFSSWPKLRSLNVWWLALALVFECLSYISLWSLQRIAFRNSSWFAVGTSQLASSAAGSIVPGGAAAAGAFQYRLLVRAGVSAGQVAAGVTATLVATTAAVLALPALALAAAIGGAAAPSGLRNAAFLGGGACVLLLLSAVAAFASDAPLLVAARLAQRAAGWLGKADRFAELPARLLAQRDAVRRAFAERPVLAAVSALGKWVFDYNALLCILAGLGVRPNAPLVLLAYASANVLGMIPATPGGLGFVEAGLVGLLTLAGIGAGVAAVATFAYRLVGFWLPLPAGLAAYVLARRRYGAVAVP